MDRNSVRFSREAKLITLLVGTGLALWLVVRVQGILPPFIWAGITAYVFSPAVNWLEARTRLRRVWVIALLYLLALAAAIWAGAVLIPIIVRQVVGLAGDMPKILTALLDRLAFLDQYLAAAQLQFYGVTIDPQVLVNEAVRNAQSLVTYITSRAIPAVFNVLEILGQVMLYLVSTFYLLQGAKNGRRRLPRLIPAAYRSEVLGLLAAIDRVLGAYIRGQLLLIGIMSLATFIALSILRVQYALIIGMISGLLEVIPLFGPIVAGGTAVSIALFQPSTPFGWSNLTLALAVVVVYVVLRQIEDQLVVPNLVGPIVDLHPLLLLFALFAGGTLAGFLGLVIAVPTAAVLKIIVIYLYGKIWDERPAEDLTPEGPVAEPAEPAPAAGEKT